MKKFFYLYSMKNFVFVLLIFLSSCEKYIVNHTTLSLSGKYVVSKMEVNYDGPNSPPDSLYTIGSTYINKYAPSPFDSIRVNGFKMYFSYSEVKMNLLEPVRDIWQYGQKPNTIFYTVLNNTGYNLGYLQFDYVTSSNFKQRVTFHIEHDGAESLQLRTVGEWPNGKFGPKVTLTLFLTRIAP